MFLTIKMCTHAKLFEIELIICIKMDLALDNRQRLICHKIQPTQLIRVLNIIFYSDIQHECRPPQNYHPVPNCFIL